MSYDESILPPAANAYIERQIAAPFPVMERIERDVRTERQPAVGRQTGALLRTLALTRRTRRVLEIGTNLGYSAIWIAAGMARDGRIEGIEIDEKLASRAQESLREAVGAERALVHRGAALDVLPTLSAEQYDFIFIDAVKAEYPRYLEHALGLAAPGAIIAADNMFWRGAVWEGHAEDTDTTGIREYTRRIFTDHRLTSTIVPVEDGLGVSVLAR